MNPPKENTDLREQVLKLLREFDHYDEYSLYDEGADQVQPFVELIEKLVHQARVEAVEATKKKLAFCTDDKTFYEEHKLADIEYDTVLKRPARAIYYNRQWQAEKQGMEILQALGKELESKEEA